jgi:small subunit ribosomal protein S16
MLSIRLARTGAKKKPRYRVVVIEKEKARDGRFLEILGHYNPTATPIELHVDRDRVQHWITKGAQPSSTVARLLARPEPAPATPSSGTV